MALVPQNFSRSLLASVANCTEKEVAQFSQNSSESGGKGCSSSPFREWEIQVIPLSPGEELQLFFNLHVSLMNFILPECYRAHQGCGTSHSELEPAGDPVPFLLPPSHLWLLCTHLPFLSVGCWPEADTIFLMTPWPEMTSFWALLSTNLFADGEEKKSLFRLFCFLPRQECSFCLCPLT